VGGAEVEDDVPALTKTSRNGDRQLGRLITRKYLIADTSPVRTLKRSRRNTEARVFLCFYRVLFNARFVIHCVIYSALKCVASVQRAETCG
jgi:hypothetical protein